MKPITSELLQLWILELLPPGSRMGNQALLEKLKARAKASGESLREEDFRAARDALIAAGQLRKGQGRGGSTVRPEAATLPPTPDMEVQDGAPATTSAASVAAEGGGGYGMYKHGQQAVSRPEVGVEEQFNARRPPKTYRYDSSLAPELCWDENAEREFAEWLLSLVAEAAEKGEAAEHDASASKRGPLRTYELTESELRTVLEAAEEEGSRASFE